MLAKHKNQIWTGFFDKRGSPVLKVKFGGLRVKIGGLIGQSVEFDAVLDTGFTGFISMPRESALPLGLMLYGTVSIELADGSKATMLTAKGLVEVMGEEKAGMVILGPTSNDILLGMDFLRLFEKALFLSTDQIFLADDRWMKRVLKWISLASPPTHTQREPAPSAIEGEQAKTSALERGENSLYRATHRLWLISWIWEQCKDTTARALAYFFSPH